MEKRSLLCGCESDSLDGLVVRVDTCPFCNGLRRMAIDTAASLVYLDSRVSVSALGEGRGLECAVLEGNGPRRGPLLLFDVGGV